MSALNLYGGNAADEHNVLFVSNLPLNLNKDNIESLFEEYGAVTGVLLFKTGNRQSAYISYKNIEEAEKAVKDLHKTPPFNFNIQLNQHMLHSSESKNDNLDDVKYQLEQKNIQCINLQHSYCSLMQNITDLQKQNTNYEKINKNLTVEIDKLSSIIDILKQKFSNLNRQFLELSSENQIPHTRNHAISGFNSTLKILQNISSLTKGGNPYSISAKESIEDNLKICTYEGREGKSASFLVSIPSEVRTGFRHNGPFSVGEWEYYVSEVNGLLSVLALPQMEENIGTKSLVELRNQKKKNFWRSKSITNVFEIIPQRLDAINSQLPSSSSGSNYEHCSPHSLEVAGNQPTINISASKYKVPSILIALNGRLEENYNLLYQQNVDVDAQKITTESSPKLSIREEKKSSRRKTIHNIYTELIDPCCDSSKTSATRLSPEISEIIEKQDPDKSNDPISNDPEKHYKNEIRDCTNQLMIVKKELNNLENTIDKLLKII